MTSPATDFAARPAVERIRELVPRYDKPGPRYTSYPTAPVWTDRFDAAAFREALRRARQPDLSIYVHIPFCERLCSFCACNRKITQDHSVAGPYLDSLEREAGMLASEFPGEKRAVQLSIGGGSPNFLSADELARLARIVDAHFPRGEGAERSIELDPRRTTRAQLEALVEHGFNRLSLGVQDTSPVVQQAINRIQPHEKIEELVQTGRALGFQGVNFDLIYGLPYQTTRSFDATLDEVIAWRPDRIALYSYAHVTWISKAQRGFEKKDLPAAEQKLEIFLLAVRRLCGAGYRFLGLDHFALPGDDLAAAADRGKLRRNFMGYTTIAGVNLVALGASGISELADAYAQSERDSDGYLARIDAGDLATLRGWRLSDDDVRRKWLIQRVMCQGEISPDAFRAKFGEELEERVPELGAKLAPLADDGLLEMRDGGYTVTAIGRIFLRVIAMAFDAYLAPPDAAQPKFSRTV